MSTSARPRPRQHPAPCPADATGQRMLSGDDAVDPALALLQRHQVGLMTPRMMGDAGRRLERALLAARHGRPDDPALLLEQLLTDLGITTALP